MSEKIKQWKKSVQHKKWPACIGAMLCIIVTIVGIWVALTGNIPGQSQNITLQKDDIIQVSGQNNDVIIGQESTNISQMEEGKTEQETDESSQHSGIQGKTDDEKQTESEETSQDSEQVNQETNQQTTQSANQQSEKKTYETTYKPQRTYNGYPYYISVNRLKNCITIYKADDMGYYSIPYKAMRCSTGGDNTPLGVYNTQEGYLFRELFYDVYGQYAVRIVGNILFHSSSYASMEKDSLIATEFNKLGKSVSHGCIRLTVEDAKWIYDNCGYGTYVEIYEDEVSGPLGKPKVIKVPEDTVWDPTDPDENNPWNDKKPSIEGVRNRIVINGNNVDLLEGITATDTCGNDITDEITITGDYNLQEKGKYTITYKVTDLLGRKAKVKATLYVVVSVN